MDYEYIVSSDQTEPAPVRELTRRQYSIVTIVTSIGYDLDRNGTRDEQHTVSLLLQMADAIERGHQSELVVLVRAWKKERNI